MTPLWVFGDACLGEEEGEYGIASGLTGDLLMYGTLHQLQDDQLHVCAILYPDARSIPSSPGQDAPAEPVPRSTVLPVTVDAMDVQDATGQRAVAT